MKKLKTTSGCHALGAAALLFGAQALPAQPIYTDPIGFNKITCLTNSDTIVGIPFRPQGSMKTVLASDPEVLETPPGGSAVLTLSLNSLVPGDLNANYVKFEGGTRDGRWYDITNNTADTITINLNGDNLTGVAADNSVVIAEYWTLDTLFPPAEATTSWTLNTETGVQVPNGHAIVASSNSSLRNRRTSLFLPDQTGTGTNRVPAANYYITNSNWLSQEDGSNSNSILLNPDTLLIIRHASTVASPTVFRSFGEVVMNSFVIPLATSQSNRRDNYVAIPRPVDMRLDQMSLITSGAFLSSSNGQLRNRKDELLVFNNAVALVNRIPSATYYHTGGNWLSQADGSISNGSILPAGAGFVIRKAQTTDGASVMWNSLPIY